MGGRVSHDRRPFGRVLGKTAAWSTLDVVVGRLGGFLQGVVVARIVAPKDFGVFAIALVIHMVVVNVSELGVSAALIRDDPAHTSRSAPTVATISLATSGLLGASIAALSSPLATALGDSHAAAPIAVMALNLPIAGLTAVSSAILRRDFRMDRVFVADFSNMIVSGVVVIALALAGWGAMALAWSWVAGQVVSALLLTSYRPGRYWLGWNRTEARRLLAFGLPLAGANLLAFIVLNVDYVIVGHVLGAETLGFYMLAFNISSWPISVFGSVITSVSLPGFSRLRLEGEAMPEQFVRAIRLVAPFTLPTCFIIGALARPAVVAIYGGRWSPAAAPLVGLAVLAAGRILVTLAADFLVSLGRTREVLLVQVPWLIALTTTLLLVAPRFGIRGVGIAQALVVLGVVSPAYLVLLRRAGVPVRDTLRALGPGLAWGVLAAAGAYAVASRIDNSFLAVATGGIVGVLIALIPFAPATVRRAQAVLTARRVRAARSGAAVETADSAVHV